MAATSKVLTAPKPVLAGMAQFDQAVAQSLIDYSAVETGHRLGVSRATVYRAMGRLREAFAEVGLSPWDRATESGKRRRLRPRRPYSAEVFLGSTICTF